MICVYDVGNTNYDGNGNAVLMPTECRMTVVAGGNYDLTMTHPIDPEGKWQHLVPGAIVKIPVPEEEIANAFSGYEAYVYKANTLVEMRDAPQAPQAIVYPTWYNHAYVSYVVGDKVTYQDGKNYECILDDPKFQADGSNHAPPNYPMYWKEIPNETTGAAVVVTVQSGTDLYLVEDYNTDWYKMSTYYGVQGYVQKSKVTYDRHLSPDETLPRIIRTQLFRITKPVVDSKKNTVTVTAKHVSYDLAGVLIQDVSLAQAGAALAIGRITEGLMLSYPGTIATDIEDGDRTYTAEIKGKNGIYALLDPDKGIVSVFDAEYRRDNWDLFVMSRKNTDRGFRLRYGKNLLGVNWSRNSDGIVTRVMPVAKDEKGDSLYLPEKYVDSDYINDYPVIRMERLEVKGQVGKNKDTAQSETWTTADLYDEMRLKAEERFSIDKVDRIQVEITVDFAALGDTEEYAALRQLEKVLLYDTVKVQSSVIGLDATLYVSQIEWDAVGERVTGIKLVNAADYGGKTVTGYSVQAKSISGDKIEDEYRNDLLQQVQGMIPQYQDEENYGSPVNFRVLDNLQSNSPTDALSANMGRALNENKPDAVWESVPSGGSKTFTVTNGTVAFALYSENHFVIGVKQKSGTVRNLVVNGTYMALSCSGDILTVSNSGSSTASVLLIEP